MEPKSSERFGNPSEEISVGKKLYVGNLPYSVDQAQLEQAFAPFGTVESAIVINDRDTGRSKGFGFVEFASDDEAQKAIDEMNGTSLGPRQITVNEARPRAPRPDRRFG